MTSATSVNPQLVLLSGMHPDSRVLSLLTLDSAKLYDMSHQHVNKLLCVTASFCLAVLGGRLRVLQN